MNTHSPKNPAGVIFPAVIFALACVFFNQSGAFFIFSLLPLGLAGMAYSSTVCWFSVSYSILLYAGSMVIFRVGDSFNLLHILLQTGVFSLLIVLFAWIIVPPQKGPSFLRLRTSIRLVMSSCVLLSVCIPIAYSFFQNEAFYQLFLSHLESILSIMPFDI